MSEDITRFETDASAVVQVFLDRYQEFKSLSQSGQAQGIFLSTTAVLAAKTAVLQLLPPMAAIHSTLTKTRDGLLIQLRRAVKLGASQVVDFLDEASNKQATFVHYYNAGRTPSECKSLLLRSPPHLQYVSVEFLVQLIDVVEAVGALNISEQTRKFKQKTAVKNVVNEIAECVPYLLIQHGDNVVVIEAENVAAMSCLLGDFLSIPAKRNDTNQEESVKEVKCMHEVKFVLDDIIEAVVVASKPFLQTIEEHLDFILDNTELPPAPTSKRGPVPLYQRFPQIVTESIAFLKENGLAAHSRRRSDTSYSMGTTLDQLRVHLLKNVPGLDAVGISKQAVHLLFKPSNKQHTWGNRHHCILDAKVAPKRNDLRKTHPNAHFCAATVKFMKDFAISPKSIQVPKF